MLVYNTPSGFLLPRNVDLLSGRIPRKPTRVDIGETRTYLLYVEMHDGRTVCCKTVTAAARELHVNAETIKCALKSKLTTKIKRAEWKRV